MALNAVFTNVGGEDKEAVILEELEKALQEAKALVEHLQMVYDMAKGNTVYPIPPEKDRDKLKLAAWVYSQQNHQAAYSEVKEQWMKIKGEERTRGIGGFFSGKEGLLYKGAGDTVFVTKKGEEMLQRYKDWLKSQGFPLTFS